MKLVRYDAACRAIAAATSVDEVKKIRNAGEAMRAYAKQAKNKKLELDAAEIRMRAERRIGELMDAQRKTVGLAKGTRGQLKGRTVSGGLRANPPEIQKATLAEAGIDKNLANRARKMAAVPAAQFEKKMSAWRKEREESAEKVSTDLLKEGDKASRRAEREQTLADQIHAMPDKKYGVLYADPPWRFEPYSRVTGMDRAPENHYRTEPLERIKSMEVPAASDCVLFLWATVPMLPQALEVMQAWHFEYRSHCIWVKDRIGTGYWNRNQHEILLIGVRGDIPAPAPGQQSPSVINAAVGKHSAKPEEFRALIEKLFPKLPKLEMFARDAAPGWDVWGNEVPDEAAA